MSEKFIEWIIFWMNVWMKKWLNDSIDRYERMKKLKKGEIGKKEWIAANKEKRRRQGKQVATDSKFTGRRRGPKF